MPPLAPRLRPNERRLSRGLVQRPTDRSWPVSDRAGRRPACQTELHLRLLGHFERIVDFNAQVPYGTF